VVIYKKGTGITGPFDDVLLFAAVSYFFLWDEQNFDFPLAEFLHAFPSFVFAAHLAAFAFGALFAFEAHFDFGLHAMFRPPSTLKS